MFTIYLFNKYVFSSYYVPGIRLGLGDLIINKKTMPNQKVGPLLALEFRPRGLEPGNRKAALQAGRPPRRNLAGEPEHRPIIGNPSRFSGAEAHLREQ